MQHVNAIARILCVMQSVFHMYYANYLTYIVKVTSLQKYSFSGETIAWLVEQGLSLSTECTECLNFWLSCYYKIPLLSMDICSISFPPLNEKWSTESFIKKFLFG